MLEHVRVRFRMDMQNCTGNGSGYVIALRTRFDDYPRRDLMKLRIAFAALLAATFFAAVPASYAAVSSIHAPAHAYFHGDKKIKFNIRNETGAPLELKAGDQVTTIKTGEVMPFKLPVGTRVTTSTATDHHKVGDVIVEVTPSMYSNSTLTIK
jgi:hypothetical protein